MTRLTHRIDEPLTLRDRVRLAWLILTRPTATTLQVAETIIAAHEEGRFPRPRRIPARNRGER